MKNHHAQYIQDNVYFRCGQAVSRLCEAGLAARPELASSENEIREWWLVSAALADKLRSAGQTVLQFHELNMWGRGSTQVPPKDDLDLRGALARE